VYARYISTEYSVERLVEHTFPKLSAFPPFVRSALVYKIASDENGTGFSRFYG
jgi:hypothetical protein